MSYQLQEKIEEAKASFVNVYISDDLAEEIIKSAVGFKKIGIRNKWGNIVLLTYDADGWYFDCRHPIVIANK